MDRSCAASIDWHLGRRIGVGNGSRRLRAWVSLSMALLLAGAGCQQAPYDLAPVRGKVSVDGQPLASGRLMFAPISQGSADAGKPAFGDIQPDGSFVLTTYREGDGAVVGDHWVTLFPPAEQATPPNLPKTRSRRSKMDLSSP